MTDYINREDVIRAIKEYFVDPDKVISERPDDVFRYNSGLLSALQVVFDVSSADVVERKYGEWIAGESWSDGYGMGEQYGRCYVCSECSHIVQDNYIECSMNFCPNCGARMKGADDETD